MNNFHTIGRLTAEPEIKTVGANNTPCASFTVACDRPFGKNADGSKKTDFYRCKAWGQKADFMGKYAGKGRLVGVEGWVELNEFTGQDGVKKYFTEINAQDVQLLDKKPDGVGNGAPHPADRDAQNGYQPQPPASQPQPQQQYQPQPQQQQYPQTQPTQQTQGYPQQTAQQPVQQAYPAQSVPSIGEPGYEDGFDPFADQ